MTPSSLIESLRDPYERKARVFPGLLVALPLLVPIVCIYGPKHPVITAVIALIGGCGAVYGLASVARGLGKGVEERLVAEWGGMPTTKILRHSDTHLESTSKAFYHGLIHTKLGIVMPTEAQECTNPSAADDAYRGASRQLRELTRGKTFSLLLKENIAYGFHRNMRGMRLLGWISSSAGVLIGLILSKVISQPPLQLVINNLLEPGLAGGLTLGISTTLWFGWFYFNDQAVKRISYVYAERLLESLRSIPKQTGLARTKTIASEPQEKS